MTFTFTAFCQEADGTGTIWIGAVEVEATDKSDAIDKAAEQAVAECADDWGGEDCGFNAETVHCLGLAEGNVKIAMWDDID